MHVSIVIAAAMPPKTIPDELLDAYTLGGRIPIENWYWDSTVAESTNYLREDVSKMMERVARKEHNYYGATDGWLYQAIEDFPEYFVRKEVAIIGSTIPWYESIILHFGGHPVTIEYNKITTDDPRIQTMTVEEYRRNPILFDTVISISSFEHDGLGRYGDPLNPYGDFRAMKEAKEMLRPGGLLFLAVPIGKEALIWNAGRVYGPVRLPMLLQNWSVVKSYGFQPSDFEKHRSAHQPIFVLSPRDP